MNKYSADTIITHHGRSYYGTYNYQFTGLN